MTILEIGQCHKSSINRDYLMVDGMESCCIGDVRVFTSDYYLGNVLSLPCVLLTTFPRLTFAPLASPLPNAVVSSAGSSQPFHHYAEHAPALDDNYYSTTSHHSQITSPPPHFQPVVPISWNISLLVFMISSS